MCVHARAHACSSHAAASSAATPEHRELCNPLITTASPPQNCPRGRTLAAQDTQNKTAARTHTEALAWHIQTKHTSRHRRRSTTKNRQHRDQSRPSHLLSGAWPRHGRGRPHEQRQRQQRAARPPPQARRRRHIAAMPALPPAGGPAVSCRACAQTAHARRSLRTTRGAAWAGLQRASCEREAGGSGVSIINNRQRRGAAHMHLTGALLAAGCWRRARARGAGVRGRPGLCRRSEPAAAVA